MEGELTLRIILETPPAGVDFGVQKGRGGSYETIERKRSDGGDLRFEVRVGVRASTGGTVDFSGPLVQGPRGERFVYVDIGTLAGQHDSSWTRRLKIPLIGITWDMIKKPDSIIEARVPGTGRDGGPNCASVKDFEGWKSAQP